MTEVIGAAGASARWTARLPLRLRWPDAVLPASMIVVHVAEVAIGRMKLPDIDYDEFLSPPEEPAPLPNHVGVKKVL